MLKKMPLIMVIMMVLAFVLESSLSIEVKSFFYALSVTLKSGIITVLPFVIFSLLFGITQNASGKAAKIIFFLFIAVFCSNYLTSFLGVQIGRAIYHSNISLSLPHVENELMPLFDFQLPKLVGNDVAMVLGLFGGALFNLVNKSAAAKVGKSLGILVKVLLGGIVTIMPLFIFGFIIKLGHDQIIHIIVKNYTIILGWVAVSIFSYMLLLYLISQKFNVKKVFSCLKNMLPAAISGFSTMSSAASMPLTILATEKNSGDEMLARTVIPTTVNIHLLADCIAINIFAMAILKSYGMPELTFMQTLVYVFYFSLAKFSVAGIPGGGVIVMLPILEAHMHFTTPMLSLVTALYVLFDPMITAGNILCNGAFALIMKKVLPKK